MTEIIDTVDTVVTVDKWVTLNNITVRIDDILGVELISGYDQVVFSVYLTNNRQIMVDLNATGGAFIHYIMKAGLNKSANAQKQYERDTFDDNWRKNMS